MTDATKLPAPKRKSDAMNDAINPKYYTELTPQPIDVIRAWNLNFNLGCVVKYLPRAGHKGDAIEDLRKAKRYLEHEISALEGKE